jgi:hypothetical protein
MVSLFHSAMNSVAKADMFILSSIVTLGNNRPLICKKNIASLTKCLLFKGTKIIKFVTNACN